MDYEFSNIKAIKIELLKHGFPQMMLTRNTRSFIGSSISNVTKGFYNHFCWLKNIDEVASQDWLFRCVPLDDYLTDKYIVKFITDTRWDKEAKNKLMRALNSDLESPFYKRLYDPVAILGQLIRVKWLQLPMFDICSDYGRYLRLTDPNYNIKYPNPTSINLYQKENQTTPPIGDIYHGYANGRPGYRVTARWIPCDV